MGCMVAGVVGGDGVVLALGVARRAEKGDLRPGRELGRAGIVPGPLWAVRTAPRCGLLLCCVLSTRSQSTVHVSRGCALAVAQ